MLLKSKRPSDPGMRNSIAVAEFFCQPDCQACRGRVVVVLSKPVNDLRVILAFKDGEDGPLEARSGAKVSLRAFHGSGKGYRNGQGKSSWKCPVTRISECKGL